MRGRIKENGERHASDFTSYMWKEEIPRETWLFLNNTIVTCTCIRLRRDLARISIKYEYEYDETPYHHRVPLPTASKYLVRLRRTL